jgi:hypothetical protein
MRHRTGRRRLERGLIDRLLRCWDKSYKDAYQCRGK